MGFLGNIFSLGRCEEFTYPHLPHDVKQNFLGKIPTKNERLTTERCLLLLKSITDMFSVHVENSCGIEDDSEKVFFCKLNGAGVYEVVYSNVSVRDAILKMCRLVIDKM